MALCILLLLCMGGLATFEVVGGFTNKTLKNIAEEYIPLNVTKLIISHLGLISLDSSDMEFLSKFKNLTELDLSSNVISVLPDTLLPSLPALRALNLSHNNLSALEHTALSGSLTELDLSHNHIVSLPLFGKLPSLERLHLQGNRLNTLTKETFAALEKLQLLALEDNPWNCSCEFVDLVKLINSTGLLTSTQATCATPPGKSILDDSLCVTESSKTSSTIVTTLRNILTSTQSSIPSKSSNDSLSSKDFNVGEGTNSSGGLPVVGNTWKFLVGVVVIALITSVVIVCAVKSPSWYKLIFNYRHQRLREEEWSHVSVTGRYSNFSLETEQTETSAHELDEGLDCEMPDEEMEDEDGFIEDRYIEPGDYKDQNES
ncbi:leucine-rich repeat-containing protein 19-like [Alosa sapidissima]|uniref:leucine-rich repeat-containing protein 19-like n=1 Tax=Alosa sapidissima TaxID=34773 RepID=UPI001C088345|nr:leucine-rich repeat-containing protein 19-like [Alosa sapidissima]